LGYGPDVQTVHGFRATARTLLAEVLEVDPLVIEAQLAHAVKDANGRAYNRTQYLKQRTLMMQRWADYLDELCRHELTTTRKSASGQIEPATGGGMASVVRDFLKAREGERVAQGSGHGVPLPIEKQEVPQPIEKPEGREKLHPKLISIDLRMQAGYAQRTLGFEKGDQIPLLENLPKGEVEEVWASVVRNIDFAKSKKQAGEELSAWSALMQASRLFGRLEPIEDYEVIPAEADELDSRLKVKAVQLFASLAPSDGWQSYSRACEEIHPVLHLMVILPL
uniref:Integrase n=1 Tax=Brugia timori TaxID=42155 RepID=A0A0R3Q5B2_9BILA